MPKTTLNYSTSDSTTRVDPNLKAAKKAAGEAAPVVEIAVEELENADINNPQDNEALGFDGRTKTWKNKRFDTISGEPGPPGVQGKFRVYAYFVGGVDAAVPANPTGGSYTNNVLTAPDGWRSSFPSAEASDPDNYSVFEVFAEYDPSSPDAVLSWSSPFRLARETSFRSLIDTPTDYGTVGQVIGSNGSALVWLNQNTSGGGTTVLSGAGEPTANIGSNGNLYVNSTNSSLWFKQNNQWVNLAAGNSGTLQNTYLFAKDFPITLPAEGAYVPFVRSSDGLRLEANLTLVNSPVGSVPNVKAQDENGGPWGIMFNDAEFAFDALEFSSTQAGTYNPETREMDIKYTLETWTGADAASLAKIAPVDVEKFLYDQDSNEGFAIDLALFNFKTSLDGDNKIALTNPNNGAYTRALRVNQLRLSVILTRHDGHQWTNGFYRKRIHRQQSGVVPYLLDYQQARQIVGRKGDPGDGITQAERNVLDGAVQISSVDYNGTDLVMSSSGGVNKTITIDPVPPAVVIRDKLEELRGGLRLNADAIRNLPAQRPPQTGTQIKTKLEALEGENRLSSSAIKDLIEGRFIALDDFPSNVSTYEKDQVLASKNADALNIVVQDTSWGHGIKAVVSQYGSSNFRGVNLVGSDKTTGAVTKIDGTESLDASSSPVVRIQFEAVGNPITSTRITVLVRKDSLSVAQQALNTLFMRVYNGVPSVNTDVATMDLARGNDVTIDGITCQSYSAQGAFLNASNNDYVDISNWSSAYANPLYFTYYTALPADTEEGQHANPFDFFDEKHLEPFNSRLTVGQIVSFLEGLTGEARLDAEALKNLPEGKFIALDSKPTDLSSYVENQVLLVTSPPGLFEVQYFTRFGHAVKLKTAIDQEGSMVTNLGVNLVGTGKIGSVETVEGRALPLAESPVVRVEFSADLGAPGTADDEYSLQVFLKKSSIKAADQTKGTLFMALYSGVPSESTFVDVFPIAKQAMDVTVDGVLSQEYTLTITQARYNSVKAEHDSDAEVYVEFYDAYTTFSNKGAVIDLLTEKVLEPVNLIADSTLPSRTTFPELPRQANPSVTLATNAQTSDYIEYSDGNYQSSVPANWQ